MKNSCLSFSFWALVLAVTVFSSMYVETFGWNAVATKSSIAASRLPRKGCQDSQGYRRVLNENFSLSVLPTAMSEKASVTCTAPKNTLIVGGRRSILACSLALALATSSFVEMANADPVSSATSPTTMIIGSSDTAPVDRLPPESSGSSAGNAVVYAWVGISAFAGVKGISDRIQQERQGDQ